MQIILGIIGIVASVLIVVYREGIGDSLGEPEWAAKAGGIYNVVIILAVIIFFWSLAYMTGTLGFLFSPILKFLRIQPQGAADKLSVILQLIAIV